MLQDPPMANEPEIRPLRQLELRLLRCSIPCDRPLPPLSDDSTTSGHLYGLIDEVLGSIESGEYLKALSSAAAAAVFKFDSTELDFGDSADCARRFYSEWVPGQVESFIMSAAAADNLEGGDVERHYRAFLVMAIGLAAFLAFSQCNMTGPSEKLPSMPLMRLIMNEEKGDIGWVEWEAWARNELMSAGSDLLGKLTDLQYLVFAKTLLMRTKDLSLEASFSSMDGLRSISWWLARVLLLQQRILDERSSSLFNLLQVFMHQSLEYFGSLEKVTSYWGCEFLEEEAMTIVSMLHLEVGIIENFYGRVDSSRLHFKTAEMASGLDLSVTGALGFRTADQVEPRAQLLLVASKNEKGGVDSCSSESTELQRNASSTSEDNSLQNHREIREASHVLMTPKFLRDDEKSESSSQASEIPGISAAHLSPVHQAVILAQCLSLEKIARQDEHQRYQMAPYIEAVDSQKSSSFMIRFFCDILRIRWESSRSRTKERALLMMDKLVQSVFEPCPGVSQRMYYCFGVHIPTIPALRKEYGHLLVSSGLVGEAMKIYEDLELWDNLIYCYRLLEKKAAAVEVIKARLSERPVDPRLWCSLGDVTNDDACYEKALEVSDNRSARAKRSLARSAYNRGDYERSKNLWESAMALNSLYPDGWFALGAAALKARDVEKALDGFTRAVQIDPDNGEAWNNIACLHMVRKKSKEAFIAFKEALKFKRNSWQLWENFSHVAVDVGKFSQAMEAVQMVLDMTNNKRVDVELLDRLMQEIKGQASTSSSSLMVAGDSDSTGHLDSHSDVNSLNHAACSGDDSGRTRETEHLLEMLGKILRQIVRSDGGAETWGLFARWHKLKGDYTMCSEALLKQVRSYQGSDLWKDKDRFKKFASASLELCEVYMELALRNISRRELLAAEMHLKNTIKQAGDFSELKEYKDLQVCLSKVQEKLQATSLPTV